MNLPLTAAQIFPELDETELTSFLSRLDNHRASLRARTITYAWPTTLVLPQRDAETVPFGRIMSALLEWFAAPNPWAELNTELDVALSAARRDLIAAALNDLMMRPLVALLAQMRRDEALTGEDSRARYHCFQERVAQDPERLVTLFPQSWTFLQCRLVQADDFLLELEARLHADMADIRSVFGLAPDDDVAHFRPTGDAHNNGRRVTIVELESGARFVYKPRSVDGEAAYRGLATGLAPVLGPLPSARVVQRDGYGYMEYVEALSEIDSRVLASRTGRLAALLYALNCRDLHFENVVVTEEGPVPIDMESMLHPHRLAAAGAANPPVDAHQLLDSSVQGVGVLPMVIARSQDPHGYYDVGFLGRGRVVAGGAFRRHRLTNIFTDQMELEFIKPVEVSDVNDVDLDEVRDLSDAFTESFIEAYRALSTHRDEVVAQVGEHCKGLRLRYLHNPTMLYSQVLTTLNSAPAAASAAVAQLLALRIGINSPDSPELIASEARALLGQNIPYFAFRTDSTAVQEVEGDHVLGRTVDTPLAMAQQKIRAMNEDDLRAQVRLIRSAFCATVPDEGTTVNRIPSGHTTGATRRLTTTDVLYRVGHDVADRAIRDRFGHLPMTWLGPLAAIEGDRPWPPGVLGYDLYTGRLGVALGLARAARALEAPRMHAVATQVFDASATILQDRSYESRNLGVIGRGAYTGLSGVLWSLWAAGLVLERPDWCVVARDSFGPLWQAAAVEPLAKRLDVVAGLSATWTITDQLGVGVQFAAETLRQAMDLITSGQWTTTETWTQSGYAHGLAGLLAGLVRQGASSVVVQPVVDRLSDFWIPEERNWHTDQRHHRSAHGWCHGRSGILLGLSAAARAGHDLGRDIDLPILARHCAAEGTNYSLTFCHGDLGTWDVLRTLAARGVDGAAEGTQRVLDCLTPDLISAKLDDPHSRYSLNDGLMVGTGGVILHLAERLDTSITVSPTTLEVR